MLLRHVKIMGVQIFARDQFVQDEGIDVGLKIILGAKVNHYEVLSIQLALAREIDALIAKGRG